MLYFKLIGFFSAESTRETGFVLVPKQEWISHESGRQYSIVSVQESVLIHGILLPVEGGISVRYLWREDGSERTQVIGYQFAERQAEKNLSAV